MYMQYYPSVNENVFLLHVCWQFLHAHVYMYIQINNNILVAVLSYNGMKLEQFAAGATLPPRKKRYIQWDEKICKLFERFQNGESSLAEYLASVRQQIGL